MPVIINQETGPAIVLFLQKLSLQNPPIGEVHLQMMGPIGKS